MSFGATASRRRQAARRHATREHTCRCGRKILGNAYYSHRKACWASAYLAMLDASLEDPQTPPPAEDPRP
jgi:lipoate-protein ligase A